MHDPSRTNQELLEENILLKQRIQELELTESERKQTEKALERRLVALTRPLEDSAGIAFEELFNLDDIQRLQDQFALATGVASIITFPDGTPITSPSSFCRLCSDIIRKTEKGCANCYKSDAAIGRLNLHGPTIQSCMSGGLWDAGAGISVGGRHIANWLIGQVRDSTQTEENMRTYAREIGADEASVVESFREVPAMSREQFERVAQALFTLANQLSATAYQNVQQARFITERKQAEGALASERTLIRTIIDSLPDRIYVKDLDRRFILNNTAHITALGAASGADVLGRTDHDFRPPERADLYAADDRDVMQSGCPLYNREEVTVLPSGKKGWLLSSKMPLRDAEGKIIGLVGISRDITKRKRAEEALMDSEQKYRELSMIDDLTRLYNARHFYVQLKSETERSNRYGQPLTLLLLDIDNFKDFNDTYGHIEGDHVLSRLGQVVKRCLRETDSAYRYGGEEFTIILPMTKSADGTVTAERIRTEFRKEAFSPLSAQEVHMTVSIGLAQYKKKEEIKAFVHRVDQLMYQGKKDGKDRVCSES